MHFALNRLSLDGVHPFVEAAVRAEDLGWTMGLTPCNPLKMQDPYIMLSQAAQATSTLHLGTLLDTPQLRHPSVLAGSICTVAEFAPGRIHCGLGVGDTAVRFNGLRPAGVGEFEAACRLARAFIRGEAVAVDAPVPARLNHATPVPLWVAAQGPKNLAMAGRVADGVWIRVGRHPANLRMAWEAVCEGAASVGRDVSEMSVGLILHTTICDDPVTAKTIAKAIAAGYYEYSKHLFEYPGFSWDGEDVHVLRREAYPDFLHHRDPQHAGSLVDFLSDEVADSFALYGDWEQVAEQLSPLLEMDLPISYVLPHPVLPLGSDIDYLGDAAAHLLPHFA
ncbi:MAG: LLM class flavin-dependent oxidoreductase [Pseudomonadota bacterium]